MAKFESDEIESPSIITKVDGKMVFPSGTPLPTSPAPVVGQIFYETNDEILYRYDGSAWIPITDTESPSSSLPVIEGTDIASTGETGGTKFLREDGDDSSSWQSLPTVAHSATTGQTASDHHAKTTVAKGTADGSITVDGGGDVALNGTKGDSNPLNHDRYTDGEAESVADTQIATHTSNADAHHTPPTLPGDIENGGTSEMSVAGLSGELADAQLSTTEKVSLPTGVGTPTYTSLKDFMDTMMSASIVSGGVMSDATGGDLDITEADGFVKTTNDDLGVVVPIKIAADTLAIANDGFVHWIYADYNGGSPIWDEDTDLSNIDHRTQIVVGRCLYDGSEIHITNIGAFFQNYMMRHGLYEWAVNGIEHASGAIISATGTRNFALTEGQFFASLNEIPTLAKNTATGDTFRYWYYGGAGWVEGSAVSQIDNLQYNNYGVGLATLVAQQYGVHWVFMTTDGDIYIVYGRGSYNLTEAQNATVPAELPAEIVGMGILVGKIIIQKSASTFTSTQTPFTTSFGLSVANDHNDLGGIQGGAASEYYHATSDQASGFLSSTQKTDLTDGGDTTLHKHVAMFVVDMGWYFTGFNAGITAYFSPVVGSSNETISSTYFPKCTIKKLYVNIFSNTLDDTSSVMLRKNGADTGITGTFGEGVTGLLTFSGTVSVAEGDRISVRVIAGGSSGSVLLGGMPVHADGGDQ